VDWDNFTVYETANIRFFIPYTQGQPLPMGQPGQSELLAPPHIHKNWGKKKKKKKKKGGGRRSFAIL
jgi:hypothetical protein